MLRWRCDPRRFAFETTDEVEPGPMQMAQGPAWEAIRFAIRSDAPDQHAFVRGLIDSRRKSLVLDALAEMRPPPRIAPDFVYVRNTKTPHRPRLLVLAPGTAREFAKAVHRVAEFIKKSSALRDRDGKRRERRERAKSLLAKKTAAVARKFQDPGVAEFLDDVVEEVLDTSFGPRRSSSDPLALYRVNVVVCRDQERAERPVVLEDDPTPAKLLGIVAGDVGSGADEHARIRTGAFVQADGGYLVLEAARLAASPSTWQAVVTTLRSGLVHVSLPERTAAALRPDPVPVHVRMILLGDRRDYRALDNMGVDFAHHFKVLVDLDEDIDRDDHGLLAYAGAISRLAHVEHLLPFHRTAVAALAEYGARVAGRVGKITARLGRVADLAREADYLARDDGADRVVAKHVRRAVHRTKDRASLDARRFLEFVKEGAILIDVHGRVIGQVNGLSVIHAGPVTYGFPARITASVGAGWEGIVDIEMRSELSGSIHTKGFQIFQGLLRRLLETDHPLAFTASLTSEQTYGRVDGDSSSAAQLCCLLSALARAPIDQGFAVTGSIDQLGRVQAVGSVDEKIEGFFDVCRELGLDGTQGVVIPRANAGDLMLRDDVVEACARGEFHVHAVETIYELLTIVTGATATPPRADGTYAPRTLLAAAVAASRELWEETVRRPVPEPDGEPAAAPRKSGIGFPSGSFRRRTGGRAPRPAKRS